MNPIQFYTRVDVTLSDKLLEVMYYWIDFYDMGLYTVVYKIGNSSCKESFRVGRTHILSKDVSSNFWYVLYIFFWCSSN